VTPSVLLAAPKCSEHKYRRPGTALAGNAGARTSWWEADMDRRFLTVVALLVAASGCSAPLTTREKGALAGGAIGAGAGAAIGSTSGHAGTGALIGAGVGAVSGAIIGDAIQGAEQKQAAQSPPPPPVVARPAPPPVVVTPAPPPVVVAPAPPPAVVAPRTIHVPPGHYPPPGRCRLWYAGRPPGHQPPPVPCAKLAAAPGAFILYNGTAWDGGYDWRSHARRHPGSVPTVIIEVTSRR
jgi:hypothetical protein